MRVLKISVLLLLFSGFAQAQVLQPGTVKLTNAKGAQDQAIYVLTIKGTIASPMAQMVEAELAKATANQSLLLRLNSEGGSVTEGEKIIALLQKEKDLKRDLRSSVMNGEICASMCVFIYVQGTKRYAGEVASFMFHGATQFATTNIPDPWKTREQLHTFTKAGVSSTWLNRLWDEGAFTKPGAYWMSGKDLIDAQSGVVTDLLSRHEIDEPWSAPFDPNIRPR